MASTLLGLAVAAGVIVAVLSSDSGRLVIARSLLGLVLPGQSVEVAAARGNWPSEIILEGIRLSDTKGPWLRLQRLAVAWRPAALLRGKVEIDVVDVQQVSLARLPESPSSQSSGGGFDLFALRRTLADIRLDKLTIDEFGAAAAVIGRPFTLAIDGTLNANGEALTLNMQRRDAPGQARVAARWEREVLAINFDTDIVGIQGNGNVRVNTRDNMLAGEISASCGATAPCLDTAERSLAAAQAAAVVGGTLAKPTAAFIVSATGIVLAQRSVEKLDAKIDVTGGEEINVAAEGSIAGSARFLPEAATLLRDPLRWSVRAEQSFGNVTIHDLQVEGGDISVAGSGQFGDAGLSAAQLTLAARGVGRLMGIQDAASQTRASFVLADKGAGRLTLDISNLPQTWQQDAATARLESDVVIAADGIAFRRILAVWGAVTLRGESLWTRAFAHTSTALTASGAEKRLPIFPSGFSATLGAKGDIAAVSATATARAAEMRLAETTYTDVTLDTEATRKADLWQGTVEASAQAPGGEIALDAGAQQVDTALVTDISLTGLAAEVRGKLAVGLNDGTVNGVIDGTVGDFTGFGALAGTTTGGAAKIKAIFTAPAGKQNLALQLDGSDLLVGTLNVDQLAVRADISDLSGEAGLNARMTAKDVRGYERALAEVTASAQGALRAFTATLSVKGTPETPTTLDTRATIGLGQPNRVTFEQFVIADGGFNAKLQTPAEIRISPTTLEVDPLVLAMEGGTVSLQGRLDRLQQTVEAEIAARGLALDQSPTAPSRIDFNARFTGPASNAVVAATLNASYSPEQTGLPQAVMMQATLAAQNGTATLQATAMGLSAQAPDLRATFPARFDLTVPRIAVDVDAPLTGQARWVGPVAPLWQLFAFDQHTLVGDADVDVTVTGTLANPDINGQVVLARTTYENFVSGTILRDASLTLAGKPGGALEMTLTARDADGGALSAAGAVQRAGHFADWTAQAKANLNRFHMLRRDDLITAATGELTYEGGLAKGQLRGRLNVVRSEIRLGATYTPEVPLLRERKSATAPANAPESAGFSTVALDVTLGVADIVRVEGKGLESFWRGTLVARGTVAQPDLSGSLTLARGTFSFLGQTFRLDSGTVTFTGGGDINPELQVVASRQVEDVTATVTISGSARAPQFALGSQPALPQDEILARILFRKDVGTLGPIESLQLASAAASLATGSGDGINGFLRKTFGLDTVSLGGSSGNALVVGRQVSGSLYVGVEQDLTASARAIVVEWRLTPSLSLRSTTNDQAGADLGVIWRKNY